MVLIYSLLGLLILVCINIVSFVFEELFFCGIV